MSKLRDRILAHDDIGRKLIDVPEWDVKVELRTMTAGKRAEMMQSAMGPDGTVQMNQLFPMLIIASAYDPETGEPIFSSSDLEVLSNKSAAVIERLGGEAMALSEMQADAVDEAGKAS